MLNKVVLFLVFSAGLLASSLAFASGPVATGLIGQPLAIAAIVVFVLAYGLVIAEEFIHLRKSKPVVFAAGIIWVLIGLMAQGDPATVDSMKQYIHESLFEYAALFLFLLVAMVYINAMSDRNVFEALRAWMVGKGWGYRKLFWITGVLAFFISPIADNLTTSLLMGAVVLVVGSNSPRFVSIAFVNIVVAANAGGAFSPFGDITTLMVWTAGKADFFQFFTLFLPSLVNYLIPAVCMYFAIPDEHPEVTGESVTMKRGAKRTCVLFLCTIATAVSFEQFLHLPPFLGMMTGLGYLMFLAYFIKMTDRKRSPTMMDEFNIFNKVAKAEWDTLLFFFGVIFCVGGLGFIGYLAMVSETMYGGWGATYANIAAGVISAVVDNIPVMFAILSMSPEMDLFQWLLVTLTAGVGGSLLSVGSAAGVALMGQSKGRYTFFSHLKWSWAIALGYAASIGTHFLVNG